MKLIFNNKYVPGLRIIKTSFAVGICLFTLSLFTTEKTLYFYGAITVIITMQTTLGYSFRLGYTRVLGSIIGSIIAYLFILIALLLNLDIDNIILIMIALAVTIQLCVILNIPEAILVACILYLASVTLVTGDKYLFYIITRLIVTIYAIIISLATNYIFFKPKDSI